MAPKTVLITGCTPGGIGHALAREFHSRGLRVFATARQTSSITSLSDLGIETIQFEATSKESIAALQEEISSRTNGALDILVNNAGRNYTVPATDVDMDEVQLTFETNVFAVMRLCQTFSPLLIASQGTIVQIGSLAAMMPYVFGSVYNATKAALHSYSDALRVELAPFGVRVMTVVTGGVKSNIARTRRELPKDSIFLPVAQEYLARQTHSQTEGVRAEDYAKRVVAQVLREPAPKRIWEGGKAWIVWFAYNFLPRGLMDRYMVRTFKLWKLNAGTTKKLR